MDQDLSRTISSDMKSARTEMNIQAQRKRMLKLFLVVYTVAGLSMLMAGFLIGVMQSG